MTSQQPEIDRCFRTWRLMLWLSLVIHSCCFYGNQKLATGRLRHGCRPSLSCDDTFEATNHRSLLNTIHHHWYYWPLTWHSTITNQLSMDGVTNIHSSHSSFITVNHSKTIISLINLKLPCYFSHRTSIPAGCSRSHCIGMLKLNMEVFQLRNVQSFLLLQQMDRICNYPSGTSQWDIPPKKEVFICIS